MSDILSFVFYFDSDYSTIPTKTCNHMARFGRGTRTIIDDLAEAWRQSVGVDSDDEDDVHVFIRMTLF